MTDPSANGRVHVELDQPRDLRVEREWTITAARLAGAEHPDRLIAFAEQRADRGPITNFILRDFAVEVLEELADTRNYLVWWRLQLRVRLDHEPIASHLAMAIQRALGLVCLAYEHVEQAQRLAELAPEIPPTEAA